MSICIVEKNINDLELMKPLWEQLNSIHFDKSVHFKKRFEEFTFDARIKVIYKKAQNGIIKFDMLLDNSIGCYVGYCLSSIENNVGEIESIYIESKYRKFKLGHKLMKNAISWFESNSVDHIEINVVYANDEVLPFYERYGFRIGNYILHRS